MSMLLVMIVLSPCCSWAGEKTKLVYKKIVKRSVKLAPCYLIKMKNGKVYEAKEVERCRDKVVAVTKDGKKLELARREIRIILFGHFYDRRVARLGRYCSRSRELKPKGEQDPLDKYELWRSFGGIQHWSDVYGGYKQVKR